MVQEIGYFYPNVKVVKAIWAKIQRGVPISFFKGVEVEPKSR